MRPSLELLLAGLFLLAPQSLPAETTARQDARVEALLPQLRNKAAQFRRAFDTPGLALAVVTRDRVYPLVSGVCEEGRARPIRPTTLFQYASVSKPITATFAAMLVSQGKLSWDDRVHDLLPWVRFASERPTRLATIRDMLSQRSGLPGSAGEFLEGLGRPQQTILRRMRFISTGENFRKKWAYSNFGITIGGVAAAAVTGQPFPAALRQRFLRRIGMDTANVVYRQFERTPNRAALHFIVDGKPVPAFVRDADAQAPGGGVSGSILDLAAFLQLHLNRGSVNGRQIVLPSALDECYRRYTDLGQGRHGADPRDRAFYGMCWDITVKPDGTEYISHGGAFSAGARTLVDFRRADEIGIVVLTNSFPSVLPEALADVFFQLYDTGRVRGGTLALFLRRGKHLIPGLEEFTKALFGLVDTPAAIDGRPLSAYAGRYRNDYIGDFHLFQKLDPSSGRNALFFKATSQRNPVKVQMDPDSGELLARTDEGGLIGLEFRDFDGAKFHKLVLPEVAPLGWQSLTRVP